MIRLPILLGLFSISTAQCADWAQWRGPEQNGLVREKAVITSWSVDGQNVLWKSDVGGRTVPIILNERAYVITPVGEGVGLQERVACLDANSGKLLWEHRFPVFHTDIVEERVGWTTLAGDPETGNIYAHGTGGELFCFDRDGKVLWKKSLTEEFGRVSGYGGRIHTPILDEDRVVISMTCSSWGEYAKPVQRYYAFNKNTGAMEWSAGPGEPPNDTSCGVPCVAVIGCRRMILAPNVDGWLYAMLSRTGETVWKYHFSKRMLNTMPVVDGNKVYITHHEENLDSTVMGCVVCLDGSRTGELDKSAEIWRVEGIEAGFSAPALHDGRLYIVDRAGSLFAMDAATGKQFWRLKLGNSSRSSPVITSDGVIYIGAQEEQGQFWILKDAGDKCETLDHKEFPRTPHGLDEVLGSPAVADGRVYFQTRYSLFCLGRKDAKVESTPPVALAEDKDGEGEKLGRTLVWPHETTLAPGEKVKLEPHAFTSFGRTPPGTFSSTKPQFTVAGVKGTWSDEDGTFTAASDNAFSAGAVKCKWIGETEGIARIRVCPKPPFKVDFESMPVDSTPPGWLNVINKTKIVERDGSKVLQKLAEKPSPPFMRIRAFMTPPITGGYTIQADMLGTSRKTPIKEFWPDMGLVNSRYEMLLLGDEPQTPKLRIVTWAPIPRLQKDALLVWKPGVWYRMKFQVKLEGGKALLRGKVWPRDEQEPAAWAIEETDPYPNVEGSPGLYAYSNGTTEKSKGAEVYFDNIEVKPND